MADAVFNTPFPGSYDPQDCLFLLKPIQVTAVPIEEKEWLIQSGRKHYSEMIASEQPPGSQYTELFFQLTARYAHRLAQDIVTLAEAIRRSRPQPITLVSLARAGTPIGALLQRALTRLEVCSSHYSISIIRDRGIDERALDYIVRCQQRPPAGIVFVDGWTAKGVISRELKQAVKRWNTTQPEQLRDELFVVSDIGGSADRAASYEDYVIPCGIMSATVSGLVSRSVLNEQIQPGDFHGCVIYHHLRPYDRSRWFLDTVSGLFDQLEPVWATTYPHPERGPLTADYLQNIQHRYGVSDINRIKPGIAEATRVMLRRVPSLLLLRDEYHGDVAHLRMLAEEKGVRIEQDSRMPFNALALIRDVRHPNVAN